MDYAKHTLFSMYKSTAEAFIAPLSKSKFSEKGVITPDEFVQAGDYLTQVCQTWSWEQGQSSQRASYLPTDKQFLVTRGVPCFQRAATVELVTTDDSVLLGDDEGWVATHNNMNKDAAPVIELGNEGDEAEDIPDLGDLELTNDDDDDEAAVGPSQQASVAGSDPLMRTRTYDLYITYDKYHQVPRFWLVGFDESKKPLNTTQILEDVSQEHARKTITVDPHPHLPLTAASIHPCKHAHTMRKLVDQLESSGKSFNIHEYLVLFLKFIASVVPTIQYDHTMSVGQ